MQEQSDRGKDEHVDHVKDESKGPYFPYDRREPYPKRLKVDFRRLPVSASVLYGVDISRGVGVDVPQAL